MQYDEIITDDENEKGEALASLAQKLVDAGFIDRAEAIARSIAIDTEKTGALVEKSYTFIKIASHLVKAGQSDRAERLLRDAEELLALRKHADHIKASLLDDIAYVWKDLNKRDECLRLWDEAIAVAKESIQAYRAGGVPDVDSWKALSSIASGLAEAGEDERVEIALQAIDNDDWRQRASERIRGVVSEDNCNELWRRLVEAETKFYSARMALVSSCRNQLVDLIKLGLEDPGQRVTALGMVKLLSIEERQSLLADVLSIACCVNGLTGVARELVLELPREWLISNIEEAAEFLLGFNDYEEYRGVFEIYMELDLGMARKLAERAVNHTDEDIRDAGNDFLQMLRERE